MGRPPLCTVGLFQVENAGGDPLHLKILGMWERVTILIFRENFKLFTVSGNQGWPLFHQPGGRQVGSIRRPLSSTNRCQAPRLAAGFGRRTKEASESPLDLDSKENKLRTSYKRQ